ncbi:hypothetical protein CFC21_026124 [Triticum aestivum]|uniref:Receptor-like serine/threonine-protein kinase n=1 Tax=Triticum aestivum TaxID=4565 RepID=A0A9R1JCB2_WHEAT|nr:hypothetical protein CFC21_026124 [Triticum aestivum]
MTLLHVFLGLLLSLHAASRRGAAAMDTVSAGNGLAGRDRLVSNNTKFALGFFKMDSKSSHTYLGIWFNKVPKIMPVWSANGESPVIDPISPELAIAGDGNLAILNQATKKVIWSTHDHANVTTNDTKAVLMNNGNFVLHSSSNSSMVFWQSFDYPTDTLLAGAKIGWDKTTGLNRRLVSRKNLIDQAPGLYTLGLGQNRLGHLLWNSTLEFWTSGAWNGRYFNLAPEMIGALTPNFTFINTENESTFMYTLRDDEAIVQCAIDVYGQGLVGAWLEPIHNWLINYRQPIFQCDVFATCGPFTICRENVDPLCSCMKGFSLGSPKDWDLGDRSHGCRRNTPLGCENEGNKPGLAVKFYPVQGMRLPHEGAKVPAATSGDDCQRICLGNCSCTAYSYGKGGCSIWHGKLYNVKQQSDASSAANGDTLYIRLAAAELPESVVNKKQSGINLVGAAVGASAAALVLVILGLVIWSKKGKWFTSTPVNGVGIISFRYADLQRATKNFTERLGGGSFGSVFKGYLSDSVTLAVKRLEGAHQGDKQFRAEVSSVGIIQHINLVKLIGFCCKGDERLLVYEFMPNQSLDVHLFKANGTALDWSLRYQIATGVARGLAYLHTGRRDCIIHCDIKPENILLDTSFVAKIADFGMAKVLGREFSQALTTTRGTIGYLAPEWISGSAVTSKVDVYSYGMVLFEIISGRRNSSQVVDGDYSAFFPLQVARKLLSGEIGSLVDPNLQGNVNLEEVVRVCKVACWCIQDDEFDRPTMAEVVQFLEGVIEVDMPRVPRLLNTQTDEMRTNHSSVWVGALELL